MAMETTATLNADSVKTLQNLIQLNIDSHNGFDEAASQIEDMTLASLFRELSIQRRSQASELQSIVSANGEQPQADGSASAAMHRAWMDLRANLGGGETAILSEAERGEDYIKEAYESALKNNKAGAVNDVLQRQYAAVKAAHDRVRDLRDEYKKA